jgi:hypothetical protein
MYQELDKYKNKGHFFYTKNDLLREQSKDVPNLPGVYLVYRLAGGKIDIVYIGKSGTIQQNGKPKDQGLRKRLNNTHQGLNRQDYFNKKIEEENIEALDIYWYVTFDTDCQDLPSFVEGLLIQKYFDLYGQLPVWNLEF